MRKLGGNIAGSLYSKSKEHPAKRFAQYWDIPESLLIYAYNDLFIDGKGIAYTLARINAALNLIGKSIEKDNLDVYMKAGKKYQVWQRYRLRGSTQRSLTLSKNLAKYADIKSKKTLAFRETEKEDYT